MNIIMGLYNNTEVILVGRAALIVLFGILVAFIVKYVTRKAIDTGILKKIFHKDPATYETSVLINKIFTETLQWVIVLSVANYSLSSLGFNFLSKAIDYIILDLPRIIGFVAIILIGLLISKIIISKIKEKELENKNEIIALAEIVIIAAFILTALEFIGVKATALIELYKVILYLIGAVIVLLLVKPEIFQKTKDKKK